MRWPRRHKARDHGRVELVVTITINRHGIMASVKPPRAQYDLWGTGSRPCAGRFTGSRRAKIIDEVCANIAKSLKTGGNPYWNLLRK